MTADRSAPVKRSARRSSTWSGRARATPVRWLRVAATPCTRSTKPAAVPSIFRDGGIVVVLARRPEALPWHTHRCSSHNPCSRMGGPELPRTAVAGDRSGLAFRVPAPARTRCRAPQRPSPPTALIGRSDELEALRSAVMRSRLTTLTGAGGCGKTRLALAFLSGSIDHYMGGSWWIELASPPIEPAD